MTRSRASAKARGWQTQNLVAADLAADLFPAAVSTGPGRPGRDVTNTPGVAFEVKGARDLHAPAWIRQAVAAADGDVPVVVWRPDGFGPASLDTWPAMLPYGELKKLLKRAGFGVTTEGVSP